VTFDEVRAHTPFSLTATATIRLCPVSNSLVLRLALLCQSGALESARGVVVRNSHATSLGEKRLQMP
jgi:hypothetical protein